MTVHANIKGVRKGLRAPDLTDTEKLELVASAKVKDWNGKWIKLVLNSGVIRGQGRFSVRSFQHVNAKIDRIKNTVIGSISDGAEKKVDFVPNKLGVRASYVPDTPFNRDILAKAYHYKCKWVISESSVDEEVKAVADVYKEAREKVLKTARDNAMKKVEDQKAIFIKGLRDRIGDGFRETDEWRKEVGTLITKEAATNIGIGLSELRVGLFSEASKKAATTTATDIEPLVLKDDESKKLAKQDILDMSYTELKDTLKPLNLGIALNSGVDVLRSALLEYNGHVVVTVEDEE